MAITGVREVLAVLPPDSVVRLRLANGRDVRGQLDRGGSYPDCVRIVANGLVLDVDIDEIVDIFVSP